MGFTDQERARIKHFGSFPDWSSLSNAIILGFPSGAHPLFLIEQAFNRLTLEGEASVRDDLCQCETLERQLKEAPKRFRARKLGTLETNPDEPDMIRRELTYWVLRLMADLGCFPNPASVFEQLGGMGGRRNAVVVSD